MKLIHLLITLILLTAAVAYADDALVLHLPFDGSPGEPVEAREVVFEQGRMGQSAHIKPTGTLNYNVSRSIDARKGTLAFWMKTAKDFGPEVAFGRLMQISSEEDIYFSVWMRISVKGKGDFSFQIFDQDGNYHGFNYGDGLKTWKADQWHHVALVWHCLKGVRVYDNGQEVFSSWGKDRWEPLTPTVLGFGCVPGAGTMADFWFDDARLYTEPLDAEQVAALARGGDVKVEKVDEKFAGILSGNPGEKLRVEVDGQTGLPEITLGKPLTIEQLLVKSAKIRKVTQGELYDGRVKGHKAISGPIDVEFMRESRITHLAFDGPNTSARIADFSIPTGRSARVALIPPIQAEKIHVETDNDGPSLNEMRFYSVRDGFREGEGTPVVIEKTEAQNLDVVGPVVSADTAVAAVSLDLKLEPPYPELVRVRLSEEYEAARSLFSADARIAGEGALKVTLDWPNYVIRAGGRLTAAIAFDKSARIADGSSLIIHTIPLSDAREEYAAQQLGWFKAWYSYNAEAHKWDSKSWQPSSMPELRWLENVRQVAPDNPLALAYYNRIFHKTSEVDVTIPGPLEAPMWARAQREAMRRTTDVVHWWIDYRQTDDGQFGGNWNDDVEMLHPWDLLVLGAGDLKVKDSMARLCDGIWASGRFTRGYSNLIWDEEHAAEESTYSQPRMVPLDYGNPKWLERCMETTSNFDFWTAVNPKGHRHFKSYMYQAQKIRPMPETDSDVPDNARAAKIGLYVVWYNDNELVKQWFREWADAWHEDSFRPVPGKPPGVIPGEIVWESDQIGREGSSWNTCKQYPLGAITYHMEDQLVGVYHYTGDGKYLAPVRAQVLFGRGGEAAQVNWRRLTGSTELDQRFIGQAEETAASTASFIAWLATGDKKYLADACVEVVREFERNRFLITEAEPPTDRVPMPGNVLLREMMLGGIGVWVCGWPQMAVSWENTGLDFAALVLESKPTELKVLAYNFGPEREIQMRVWELEPGVYELKTGIDGDRDDAMDAVKFTERLEVQRAARLPIQLPENELTVIEMRQLESRPIGKRTDLAISSEDVGFSEDRRTVTVNVHNIGSVPAQDARVVVYGSGDRILGEASIRRLASPDDLTPKTVQLMIRLSQPLPDEWRLVIDPENKLDEITKENNSKNTP